MAKYNILAVDDMLPMRNFIKYGLEKLSPDIYVDLANNGKEALMKLESSNYDLVLCDWEMPIMKGIDLLHWMRSNPFAKNIPVIMITVRNDRESILTVKNTGVSGYIVKPFTIADLAKKISEIDPRFTFDKSSDNARKSEASEYSKKVSETFFAVNFDSHFITGSILDISNTEVIGQFVRKDPLPHIMQDVLVDLKSAEHKISNIKAVINKLHIEDPLKKPDLIVIGAFYKNMPPNKAVELKIFLNSIK